MSDGGTRDMSTENYDQADAAREELVELVNDMLGRGFDFVSILAGLGAALSQLMLERAGPLGYLAAARWHKGMGEMNAALAPPLGAED